MTPPTLQFRSVKPAGLELGKEISRADFQRSREAVNVVQADVPFSAFHLANIAAVEIGDMRQTLLAETVLFTEFAKPCTKILALLALKISDFGHGINDSNVMSMNPRTISTM